MNINEAVDFFQSLISKTEEKSSLKIYDDFLEILSDLKQRDLTEEQFLSIETELDGLDLKADTDRKKKYLRRQLSKFKKYLKNEHSLIPAGYYTQLGIALGMNFGLVVGLNFGIIFGRDSGITNGLVLGMIFGLALGIVIGQNMDATAKKEGRVLKTKIEEDLV